MNRPRKILGEKQKVGKGKDKNDYIINPKVPPLLILITHNLLENKTPIAIAINLY